ncbi:NADP-dependent succinate-semialdehyde dehydrogenase [Toxoplasma gondii VAND]|uniref:NADP-dependent succinate-semialdehyde dehydrogenase n=1 Tax=Toxoplasma gondii VAND TaxID=933077 RepID=A0A086PKE4_TOXGO|nr:NADP-dependent succinate-semialdehyde dehydrogenase [Toxoplasma gondii VAND]
MVSISCGRIRARPSLISFPCALQTLVCEIRRGIRSSDLGRDCSSACTPISAERCSRASTRLSASSGSEIRASSNFLHSCTAGDLGCSRDLAHTQVPTASESSTQRRKAARGRFSASSSSSVPPFFGPSPVSPAFRTSRPFATMSSAFTDTTASSIAKTRELLKTLQLGAVVNGVWLRSQDTDCSTLPPSLASLLPSNSSCEEEETEGAASASFAVTDPATGQEIYRLPALGRIYTRAAIAAAEKTQREEWGCERKAPVLRRHHVLLEWERLVKQEKESIAHIMTLESGKPLAESRNEVMYAASFIGWFAEQIRRENGIIIPSPAGDKTMIAYRQPVGVCALITPWNFPAAMLTRKAAAALAAGCCCVCKVPHDAPLSALYIAKLAEKAGVPKGALNVLTTDSDGSRRFGAEVCQSEVVRKISFTGSTAVGKLLMRQAADTVKRVSMELGGNAPFIVFEDANIDEAVQAIVACKFRGAGQTCVCANRVYVHRDVWDQVVPAVVKLVREQIVGHGLTHGVSIGPVINQKAVESIDSLVEDAVERGAKILLKGGPNAKLKRLPEELSRGSFYWPVVLDCREFDGQEEQGLKEAKDAGKEGAKEATVARILQAEIFGPVLALYSFSSEEEVIRRANATRAGLAAYMCSENINRVRRVSAALEGGMVGVNTGVISAAEAPFGGVKESGVGREGSIYGLDEYSQIKYVCVGGGHQ